MYTAKKMKFSIKDFFSKYDQILKKSFTEEILNGKLHCLCSVILLWLSLVNIEFKKGPNTYPLEIIDLLNKII